MQEKINSSGNINLLNYFLIDLFYFFQGLNPRLVFAVSAAALGSAFQHGYNLGVINAPLQVIKNLMSQSHKTSIFTYFDTKIKRNGAKKTD